MPIANPNRHLRNHRPQQHRDTQCSDDNAYHYSRLRLLLLVVACCATSLLQYRVRWKNGLARNWHVSNTRPMSHRNLWPRLNCHASRNKEHERVLKTKPLSTSSLRQTFIIYQPRAVYSALLTTAILGNVHQCYTGASRAGEQDRLQQRGSFPTYHHVRRRHDGHKMSS